MACLCVHTSYELDVSTVNEIMPDTVILEGNLRKLFHGRLERGLAFDGAHIVVSDRDYGDLLLPPVGICRMR